MASAKITHATPRWCDPIIDPQIIVNVVRQQARLTTAAAAAAAAK